ncbi:MAG: hypothetical protein WA945_07835 [Arcobacteraceae bacterium]
MKKIIISFFIPFYLFAITNPYDSLSANEKLNVMANHFLNVSLENVKPPVPIKRELADDGATLDPVKYEQYFSYIQRLKAITESRAEEQIRIDEEYRGKLGFYNGKLNSLEEFYQKDENLYPVIAKSVNKAFKIVYGKPVFSDIVYDDEVNLLKANLNSRDIYGVEKFQKKEVELFIHESIRDDFMTDHQLSDILVRFEYDGTSLMYKDILITYKGNEYIGNFLNRSNQKIKLKIKINDDIFRPINTGESK